MSEKLPTILVVDDEAELREILSEFLISGGHSVVEASSGEDALRVLRNIPSLTTGLMRTASSSVQNKVLPARKNCIPCALLYLEFQSLINHPLSGGTLIQFSTLKR